MPWRSFGTRTRVCLGWTAINSFTPPPRLGPFSPPFSWSVRFGLLGLALVISGLVSYWLARTIASPVRRLQDAAHTLSAGNLDARAGPAVAARRDEIGVLGREFDSMAERLSALIAARQRLLRDTSHELRSPLARMEMAIGLARQDAASTPEQLDRIEREAERLDRLIGHILDYARLERDPATFTFEEVDLPELIRQIVHDAEFESQSPPGRLRFTCDDGFTLHGDAQVLHAAIDNVVRNALIYGDVDLPIEVGLTVDAEQIHITIRDHGPGVRESDLTRIFEPFYRAGSLDSKHISTEGTGVGLAITQRAVALHGGGVVARNADDGGLIVSAFIDAEKGQIESAAACGFAVCEVHTGPYAHAFWTAGRDPQRPAVLAELEKVRQAGQMIRQAGMRFNAGHALNYVNVQPIARLEGVRELHIGHAIVSRAVFVGMREAVAEMKRLMREAAAFGES